MFCLLNVAGREFLSSLPALLVSKWLVSSVSLLGVIGSAISGVGLPLELSVTFESFSLFLQGFMSGVPVLTTVLV